MTLRELQTLSLVAEGKPYIAIADELHVSYKTVVNTCAQLEDQAWRAHAAPGSCASLSSTFPPQARRAGQKSGPERSRRNSVRG